MCVLVIASSRGVVLQGIGLLMWMGRARFLGLSSIVSRSRIRDILVAQEAFHSLSSGSHP